MTRKSLFAVILAVVGLAFVLGSMAVDPASAKGRRELHSVELLPVSPPGNVIECDEFDGPGDCESDGFGTAAVATDNNFQVTSWGATLQNLLRYTDYYLWTRDPGNPSPCTGVLVYEGTFDGPAMTTDGNGLASRNELSAPTVTEGDIVDACDDEGWQILTGDLTTGGKENVHRNNAKNKNK